MESSQIVEFFREKSILVTGSTGFLAKILVEKLLRVQPDVKRLFLLVRAPDAPSATQRMQSEILGKELFNILRDKHGSGFQSFVASKLFPVPGDIVQENLGIQDSDLTEKLWKEVDVVVNVAATTNFYLRYDVALDINVRGAKHALEFAKQCARLEMFLHVSTAYVAGEQSGLILEKKIGMGETPKGDSCLDIEAELRLVEKKKEELQADNVTEEAEKIAMKELGIKRARFFGWPNTYVYTKAMGEMLLGHLRGDLPLVIVRPAIITSVYREPLPGWIEGTRTIDSLLVAYAKGRLPCLVGDPDMIVDVIPGDMVVNAMMATMAVHWSQQGEFIYHVGSSTRNPLTYCRMLRCGYRYFFDNPRIGKNGEIIKTRKITVFTSMARFYAYVFLRHKLPLEIMHLVNLLSCGLFGGQYYDLNRMYKFGMRLLELYEPYAFFKGFFDDLNLESLRMRMNKLDDSETMLFDFDTKHVDWKSYFVNIHIPGVLKYAFK